MLSPLPQDEANGTGIFLNPFAVCSQEQDISLRYLEDVGDIPAFSKELVRILRHAFLHLLFGAAATTAGIESGGLRRDEGH